MTTFNDLVTRVQQQLLGYVKDQFAQSTLTADIASNATTFTVDVDTVENMSRGLVEIDDELILVKSKDQVSGVVTVMGGVNGRGQQGTAAAAHSTNAIITSSPAFPRVRVKEAINDTIRALYPDLVAFGTTNIIKLAPVYEYEMPAESTDVWYVTGSLVGPTRIWQPLPNNRFNPLADTGRFPSGKSIQIFDFVTPGQSMRVTYSKAPSALVNSNDDFATTTGLPDRCVDLVTYGACWRLIPALDAARLQQQTVESTERANLVQPTNAARISQYYLGLYQQRLEEEKSRQFYEHPRYQTFQGS